MCVCGGGGGGEGERVVNGVLLSATTCYCSSTYQFTYGIAGNLANIEFSEMAKNGYKFILPKLMTCQQAERELFLTEQQLNCVRESTNSEDLYAVAVIRKSAVVGH